jgi:murein L,D-transpeptidase YcbB/YkuD
VKRFQARHGLDVDGVIGTATRSALQVPLAWRVRQIELALERWRWIPASTDARTLVLNIPLFELATWEAGAAHGAPAIEMRVIVGAPRTPTPVLSAEMRSVILRPYWNVPTSILRNEILPLIARDVDYLADNQMEIVRGQGDDAVPVSPSPEHIAELRAGLLRLRQRPGPHNALGLVKFHFENEEHVYLHGTPAQSLFQRSRRAFSHGCLRVEDPITLAEWILQGTADWSRERILEAAEKGRTQQVPLARPVQVTLVYITAAVTTAGAVRFADDLYGRDVALDRALRR